MKVEKKAEKYNLGGKKYLEISSSYLANGLAFIGFKYFKKGFGKDTVYLFEETQQIQQTIDRLMEMRKELK